jgi:hypothetical protein
MDRFFATLPFGKILWRSNWSISTDGKLFKPRNSHKDIKKESNDARPPVYNQEPPNVEMTPATYEPTQSEMDDWKEQSKKIDPTICYLRMERQTLHRLQKTGAIVFGFKTFLEPIPELKREGCGKLLADGLNGLRYGSVPAMDDYKDGVIWREPLVEYLTS